MYCQVCGAESIQGFNFCKRCGSSLVAASITTSEQARPPRTAATIWALSICVMVVCAGGLGISLGIAGGLAASGVRGVEGPVQIALAGSTVALVVSLALLRLLARVVMASIGAGSETSRRGMKKFGAQAHQEPPRPALQEPPRAVGSVTENTTRNFERPVYSERREH